MRTWRAIAAATLGGALVMLPGGSQALVLRPEAVDSAFASAVALRSGSAVASLRGSASFLPTGQLRILVRTGAPAVTVKYVVLGRSTRTLSVRVKGGTAGITLPASATSARVKGAAGPGHRATGWLRLAIPPRSPWDVAPTADAAAQMEAQLVALVNEARASGVTCPGGRIMAPVPPLSRNPALDVAARAHAGFQARTGLMSHTGPGGSTVGKRLTAAGFRWSRASEVVAAGRPRPEDTLAQWLGSAAHCEALMDPDVSETGVGYAHSETSLYRHFWTQDFARS